MRWANAFVELNKSSHNRRIFDCGRDEPTDFLRTKALRHMQAGISRTMVLPEEGISADSKTGICAYYTITPSLIESADLPQREARKLPRYPIPVFLIAQLAVHCELHGKGLGKVTLYRAVHHLCQISEHLPAYAIVVDALDNAVEGFYAKFGFQFLCVHQNRKRLFLSMKTALELCGFAL